MDIGMRDMRIEMMEPAKSARMDIEGVESASRLGPIRASDAPRDKYSIEPAVEPFRPSGTDVGEEKWASSEAKNVTRGKNEIDVGSATKAKTVASTRDCDGRYGCRLEPIPCDIAAMVSQSSQRRFLSDSKQDGQSEARARVCFLALLRLL